MLNSLLSELKGRDVFVIDSDSTFGKYKFWMRWEGARQYCLNSKHDNFLILPDDVCKIDLLEIEKIFNYRKNKPFFCNVINDGRNCCWGKHRTPTNDFRTNNYAYIDLGYFDCGGLTNRATLKHIEIVKPSMSWFDSTNKSSGVGHQITTKSRAKQIPMFTPFPTLCYHGDHESVMHPQERKQTPLIAIK